MTLVKFRPSTEVGNFDETLKKCFEGFESPFRGNWNWSKGFGIDFNANEFKPRVDITEDNENLFVEADIPGVDKKDVKVSVVGDVLTISGEKKKESKDENKNYYKLERTSGSFSRSFTLPAEINTDKISAEFKDGVLKVTLPKTEEAKVVEKQIEIK